MNRVGIYRGAHLTFPFGLSTAAEISGRRFKQARDGGLVTVFWFCYIVRFAAQHASFIRSNLTSGMIHEQMCRDHSTYSRSFLTSANTGKTKVFLCPRQEGETNAGNPVCMPVLQPQRLGCVFNGQENGHWQPIVQGVWPVVPGQHQRSVCAYRCLLRVDPSSATVCRSTWNGAPLLSQSL